MAEFPALPLFVDAWIADTRHLSRLERGTYHDLLVLMWLTPECRVPNDKAWLARRLGLPIEIIEQEIMPLVREFCINNGNWIIQGRLRQEFEYLRRRHHSQSDRAKSRWRKEKASCPENSPAYAPIPNLIRKNIAQDTNLNGQEAFSATFIEFWLSYPRKVGKRTTEKKYKTVLSEVPHSEIMAGLERAKKRWEALKTEPKFIPYPLTWLNQGRWADAEPEPPVQLEGRFY